MQSKASRWRCQDKSKTPVTSWRVTGEDDTLASSARRWHKSWRYIRLPQDRAEEMWRQGRRWMEEGTALNGTAPTPKDAHLSLSWTPSLKTIDWRGESTHLERKWGVKSQWKLSVCHWVSEWVARREEHTRCVSIWRAGWSAGNIDWTAVSHACL